MTISLIIPCYNEEANLQKGVLDKIGNYTKDNSLFTEIIIVDDGSSDTSREIIKEKYLKSFPKFKLIVNDHQGKAFAIIKGIRDALGEYVIFSDIDLATPIEEADKLIKAAIKGDQIIIGSRNHARQGAPLSRKVMSLGSVIIKNAILGLSGIKDTQCGFKMFQRKIALDIISRLQVYHIEKIARGSSVSAGFDLEFLFLAKKLKISVKEIPVIWRHVETRNVNFLKDTFESLKDILEIKINDFQGHYEK